VDDAGHLIGVIPKNAAEELRVALTEFHGFDLIDLRIFADFDGAGVLRPTKKGITLRVERLEQLIETLQTARDEAARRGLIETS
jgi:hypothetical protein